MKYTYLAFLALIVSLSNTSGAGGAATTAQLSFETQNAIAAAVRKELAAYGASQPVPGAVVGVWVPGKGELTKGFGYANLSLKTPMALDDHFRIGSITKTFVATVLLQLVDERKLSRTKTASRCAS
jgi:D-alanyl-D-alanine carboxypeptidase